MQGQGIHAMETSPNPNFILHSEPHRTLYTTKPTAPFERVPPATCGSCSTLSVTTRRRSPSSPCRSSPTWRPRSARHDSNPSPTPNLNPNPQHPDPDPNQVLGPEASIVHEIVSKEMGADSAIATHMVLHLPHFLHPPCHPPPNLCPPPSPPLPLTSPHVHTHRYPSRFVVWWLTKL